MAAKRSDDGWMYMHADLMALKPKARAARLQKLKNFFCFGCGRDIQNDYCRCSEAAAQKTEDSNHG